MVLRCGAGAGASSPPGARLRRDSSGGQCVEVVSAVGVDLNRGMVLLGLRGRGLIRQRSAYWH